MSTSRGLGGTFDLAAFGVAQAEAATGAEVLESRRAMVEPFLRAAVETMPPWGRRIAGYHMGWLDSDGHAAPSGSGKAIRAAMALGAAEAVGGSAQEAVPAAAAVELVHNSSLLHDDIIDHDRTRRHRPTAWTVFGTGPALCAGDALLALSFDVLGASGHPAATGVATMLSASTIGLLEGQCEDLSFERRSDVTLAECVAMATRKTALLMGCACAAGASFGGGQPAQVAWLRSFGEHTGVVFQLVDDLLGIWGDPHITGKPVFSDLQNRKKTLPVMAALDSGEPASSKLASLFLTEDTLSPGELACAADLIEQAGGRAWCESQLEAFMSLALGDLELAQPTGPAAAELRALACMIGRRRR